MSFTTLGLMFICATMLALLLMPFNIRAATALGAVDVPEGRHTHTRSTPLMGGMAITLAFLVTSMLFLPIDHLTIGMGLGAVIALLTGMADDVWQIRPIFKFVCQIAAATVFVLFTGQTITNFGDLFGTGELITGPYAEAFTIFAIVSLMNALNLSDGLNGLAGGLSIIACAFLLFFAYKIGSPQVAYLGIALIGSIVGFLYFNMYPAKIFMGDTGALTLGYFLGTFSVILINVESTTGFTLKPISLALILCLPILDTLFVMLRRLAHRQSPSTADNRHLHHALLALNFSQSASVSVLYILMFIFCGLAVLLIGYADWIQLLVGFVLATLLIGGLTYYQSTGHKIGFKWLNRELSLVELPYYRVVKEWLEHSERTVSVLIPVSLILPSSTFPSMQSSSALTSLLSGALLLMLFPWKASKERSNWVHGVLYAAIVLVLVELNISGPSWTPVYLQYATLLVSVWVAGQLLFNQNAGVFITSSIEVLVIILAWAVPIFTQSLAIDPEIQRLLAHSCIESIPFLVAMKIVIRGQPGTEVVLVSGIALTFLLISLRQLIA